MNLSERNSHLKNINSLIQEVKGSYLAIAQCIPYNLNMNGQVLNGTIDALGIKKDEIDLFMLEYNYSYQAQEELAAIREFFGLFGSNNICYSQEISPFLKEKKEKLINHDVYLYELIDCLNENYAALIHNLRYLKKVGGSNFEGDIDLFAIAPNHKPGLIDFIEVKCYFQVKARNNNLKKAKSQLRKARRTLGFKGQDYVFSPAQGLKSLEQIARELNKK